MTCDCKIVPGKDFGELAALLKGEPEIYLIYDENAAWVAGEILSAVPGVRGSVGVETSEEGKTLETVSTLERQLLAAGASRKALVLAVGGGITTDLAGFAAAIYKRGIRYANVPTTLLGMVDAAIGGKTGVNLDGYKNMLGAFAMPEFTFLCPAALRTLPAREQRCGLAEMAKTFLIADAEAYAALVAGSVEPLILRAARIKAEIVRRDPLEQGERAVLNLGHTFGHAMEHAAREAGEDLMHGEAVAMGLVLAARLSEACGVAAPGLSARLSADLSALGLPVENPYPLETLASAMEKDKKAGGGKVKFVLLEAPGKPVFKEMSVKEAMDDLHQYSK